MELNDASDFILISSMTLATMENRVMTLIFEKVREMYIGSIGRDEFDPILNRLSQ